MSHSHTMGHSHGMAHSHNVGHSHSINHGHSLPSHTHQLLDHTHNLTPGIEYAGNAQSFKVIINGVERLNVSGKTLNRDISEFMVNAQKKIPRNTYFKIEILPNDAAWVQITVSLQGFIQSRGNYTM